MNPQTQRITEIINNKIQKLEEKIDILIEKFEKNMENRKKQQ